MDRAASPVTYTRLFDHHTLHSDTMDSTPDALTMPSTPSPGIGGDIDAADEIPSTPRKKAKREPDPHMDGKDAAFGAGGTGKHGIPKRGTPSSSPNKVTSKNKAKVEPGLAAATSARPGYPGHSDKQRYALLLFDYAVRTMPKTEVQAATGLTPDQQKQLTRVDKGSLRRAFEAFVETL